MAGRDCGGEFRAHNIDFSESEIGLWLCVAERRIVRHCAAEKHKTTSKFNRVIERQLKRNWYCVPVFQETILLSLTRGIEAYLVKPLSKQSMCNGSNDGEHPRQNVELKILTRGFRYF
jgi:hypothetical protein